MTRADFLTLSAIKLRHMKTCSWRLMSKYYRSNIEYNLMFMPENPKCFARKMDGTPYLGRLSLPTRPPAPTPMVTFYFRQRRSNNFWRSKKLQWNVFHTYFAQVLAELVTFFISCLNQLEDTLSAASVLSRWIYFKFISCPEKQQIPLPTNK